MPYRTVLILVIAALLALLAGGLAEKYLQPELETTQ